ncbi:MAG: replication protein [Minisyncoccia bacterium]
MYPNILSEYWCQLSGSEQKVLDFILRQTIGWRKSYDRIALSQFVNGVGESNRGTGLSTSQVHRAIKSLEEKGFIEVKRNKNRPSTFSLVLVPEEEEVKAEDFKAFDAFKDVRWI